MNRIQEIQNCLVGECCYKEFSFDELFEYDINNFNGDSRMLSAINVSHFSYFRKLDLPEFISSYLRGWCLASSEIKNDVLYTRQDLMANPHLMEIVIRRRAEWKRSVHSYYINIPLTLAYLWLRGDYGEDIKEEKVLEPVEEEDLKFHRHYYNVTVESKFNTNFNPVFVFDDTKRNVLEDDTIPLLESHNGQRKLLLSFMAFLNRYYNPGDKILFFGSAPGIAIQSYAEKLKLKLVCVDDFPSVYHDGNEYMSFDYFFSKGWSDYSFDGIFFDHFFRDKMQNYNYDLSLEIIAKYPGAYYSIKKFVDYGSSGARIMGSKLIPMLYSKKKSSEYREEGVFDQPLVVVNNLDISHAVRDYVYYTRSKRSKVETIFGCSCYDCAVAEYCTRTASLKFSLLLSDLVKLNHKVQEGTKGTYGTDLVSLSNVDCTLLLNGVVRANGYVWAPKVLHLCLLESDPSLFFGRVVDIKEFHPLTDQRYSRYVRKPLIAKFVVDSLGDDDPSSGVVKVFSLPAVCVTAIEGKESYYSIAGKPGVVYSYIDGVYEPACLSCNSANTQRRVVTRDFLALFRPISFHCKSCDKRFKISYADPY